MLSSISPLGEQARSSRWWVTTAAYLIGSLAGGLVLGGLAGLLGSALPAPWRASPWALGLAAALLLLGLALDLAAGGRKLPSWRRQVDEQWLTRYRGWVYGIGFGAQLGFGLVTIITRLHDVCRGAARRARRIAGSGPAHRGGVRGRARRPRAAHGARA